MSLTGDSTSTPTMTLAATTTAVHLETPRKKPKLFNSLTTSREQFNKRMSRLRLDPPTLAQWSHIHSQATSESKNRCFMALFNIFIIAQSITLITSSLKLGAYLIVSFPLLPHIANSSSRTSKTKWLLGTLSPMLSGVRLEAATVQQVNPTQLASHRELVETMHRDKIKFHLYG